ncbi:hypothetical protein ACN47E_000549 [Coniothyrium glycines]
MKEEIEATVEKTKGLLQDLVVVVSLIRTLTDSFGSAGDLYRTLRHKSSKRKNDDEDESSDHRQSLKPSEFILGRNDHHRKHIRWSAGVKKDDYSDSEEELICTSSSQVRAEYEHGYRRLGEPFARGDLIAHTQLQFQIIQLQQTLLNIHQDLLLSTYLAPSSSHSHLVRLIQTIRSARTGSVQALQAQYQRMLPLPSPERPRPMPGAYPMPSTGVPKDPIGPLTPSPRPGSWKRSRSWDSSSSDSSAHKEKHRPRPQPVPVPDMPLPSRKLFCIYARDLQRDSTFPMAKTFTAGGSNLCPFCRSHIAIRPGKAWEIIADSCDRARNHGKPLSQAFLIRNRFIVKSHRANGGFACLICAKCKSSDTVCREVAALMEHLWREHTSEELEQDEDIVAC